MQQVKITKLFDCLDPKAGYAYNKHETQPSITVYLCILAPLGVVSCQPLINTAAKVSQLKVKCKFGFFLRHVLIIYLNLSYGFENLLRSVTGDYNISKVDKYKYIQKMIVYLVCSKTSLVIKEYCSSQCVLFCPKRGC